MKIADFGELTGVVALFGGAYSNLQATQAMIEALDRHGIPISNRIFTGDAVAYCGNPQEVVRALNGQCEWVAGNCETQLASGAPDCGCGFDAATLCDRLSAEWYAFAQGKLDTTAIGVMAKCPDVARFTHEGRRVGVIHGGVKNNARFIWPTSPKAVFQEEISAIQELIGPIDVVVAGHCGIAFQRMIDGVLWINAGVLGMPPHDGRPQTRYAILGKDGVRFERLEYDHKAASDAIRTAGLADDYADALTSGYWPSEDVLPPEMRRTRPA